MAGSTPETTTFKIARSNGLHNTGALLMDVESVPLANIAVDDSSLAGEGPILGSGRTSPIVLETFNERVEDFLLDRVSDFGSVSEVDQAASLISESTTPAGNISIQRVPGDARLSSNVMVTYEIESSSSSPASQHGSLISRLASPPETEALDSTLAPEDMRERTIMTISAAEPQHSAEGGKASERDGFQVELKENLLGHKPVELSTSTEVLHPADSTEIFGTATPETPSENSLLPEDLYKIDVSTDPILEVEVPSQGSSGVLVGMTLQSEATLRSIGDDAEAPEATFEEESLLLQLEDAEIARPAENIDEITVSHRMLSPTPATVDKSGLHYNRQEEARESSVEMPEETNLAVQSRHDAPLQLLEFAAPISTFTTTTTDTTLYSEESQGNDIEYGVEAPMAEVENSPISVQAEDTEIAGEGSIFDPEVSPILPSTMLKEELQLSEAPLDSVMDVVGILSPLRERSALSIQMDANEAEVISEVALAAPEQVPLTYFPEASEERDELPVFDSEEVYLEAPEENVLRSQLLTLSPHEAQISDGGFSQENRDLLPRVKGLYRLLEIHSEPRSGGPVDKVIIAQESLRLLIEKMSPGAYKSISEIDFTALDQLSLKPIGVYGSQDMIATFLRRLEVVDDLTYKALLGSTTTLNFDVFPIIRCGIYFLSGPTTIGATEQRSYIIYWPEATTWDDDAISSVKRNRVTFMRYLTKLTDQVVALLSPEHADAIVWNQSDDALSTDVHDGLNDEERLFTFEVQKTQDKEESVIILPGYSISVPLPNTASFPWLGRHSSTSQTAELPRLASGETRQGLLTFSRIQVNVIEEQYGIRSYNRWPSYPPRTVQQERIQCTVDVFTFTLDDLQRLSAPGATIVQPVYHAGSGIKFFIPTGATLRHVHLLENGKMLVLVDQYPKTKVYLENDDQISGAIERDAHKKTIDLNRIGGDFLLKIDESKRLIVLLSHTQHHLHVFGIDENFVSVYTRGSDYDLRPWVPHDRRISSICFVSGSEEILLLDASGLARVFSLVTEQMRPATLQLGQLPDSIVSTPDGSCLVTLTQTLGGEAKLRVFPWSTFGMKPNGIELDLPNGGWSNMVITSIGNRNNVFLTMFSPTSGKVESVRLSITSKASAYAFRSRTREETRAITKHNSLIECHADVWTRYPIVAAIPRVSPASSRTTQTITFVASRHHEKYRLHFRSLVQSFQNGTHKPTNGVLDRVSVSAETFESFLSRLAFRPTSVYPLGKWLVELVCLIPIHLAIASGNRFIPLKDGVLSANFENSLFGADVLQISNSITLGWYESIFQSYMATKPIKVVSSMGEQSVGKSFALNHFVDTSFAGSAMRSTEGAWLSVTPTETDLIVALDFEGIHSVERSAQEDMLLVLFNSALSNLILFRNNFALSRDIASLFTSFQSSTALLEPAANPYLFQSTLAIIIKDVVDSDSPDIAQEFSQKFQKIVQDEKEGNFITKLHRGRLDIITWPVIGSARFYSLMSTVLKKQLDAQRVSHDNALVFSRTLKTLMAKLKTSDWRPLDQNLASHRAQVLQNLLPNALAYGVSNGPLRHMDTKDILLHQDSDAFFDLNIDLSGDHSSNLVNLCRNWSSFFDRHSTSESEWVLHLTIYLQQLAEHRVEHVRNWIDANTSRLSAEHADIQNLRRQFDTMSRGLISGVSLCSMKCSECGLLCLKVKRHSGSHDCQTSHKCPHACDMDVSNCRFSAGHDGRHICETGIHLCGELCHLSSKGGCQKVCDKPLGHSVGRHTCSAKIHACGKPCDLYSHWIAGMQLCSSSCILDCQNPHTRHVCERQLICPATCRLCDRLCAVKDHFHALVNDALHLCGDEHACEELCSMPGICDIAAPPPPSDSTLVENETFNFTEYTQVATRLRCVVPIPPNKLTHAGGHIHSTAAKLVHTCETRCPSCQYFCTLPLGHPKEHETSHGLMKGTSWAIDGDGDATQEIQGRKFRSGDSGASMFCHIVCGKLGRHTHIDFCRTPDTCIRPTQSHSRQVALVTHHTIAAVSTKEVEHIDHTMLPDPARPKDWITHALYWARSGFKDPYSHDEQVEFAKCDSMCAGEEHEETERHAAKPSYCTLPMFHTPVIPAKRTIGHVSSDGHEFLCKSPTLSAFHVIFVLDRSGSMGNRDRRPSEDHFAHTRISRHCDNRYGAVLSAVYDFWHARETAAIPTGGMRRDAYSIVLLGSHAETSLSNDLSTSPDDLLSPLLNVNLNTGTNFGAAILKSKDLLTENWNKERLPVVIFLSDGECDLPEIEMYDLCRRSVALGHPLSFYSVSFGPDASTSSLKTMADIARDVYSSSPAGQGNAAIPCRFTDAIETIELAETFHGIAESMRKTRASLIRPGSSVGQAMSLQGAVRRQATLQIARY